MIKILLLEDEIPARKKLLRFIKQLDTEAEVVAAIDTVENAISFLKNNTIDLILSDIELLDGNAFEIYNTVPISCPIIFTTAYDSFWMHAFESNGLAYLLKPFSEEQFKKAWNKFLLFRKSNTNDTHLLANLTKLIQENFKEKSFKKRFTINTFQGIYFLDTANITYFKANEGVIFAFDTQGRKHLLSESTLKEIEALLNPSDFFKINRSELVSKQHIEKIDRYAKNTLAINMKNSKNYLVTSQSMTASFREWIER